MGFRPGEWERLEPIEIYALEAAESWRFKRRMSVVAVAIATLANRTSLCETPLDAEEFLEGLSKLDLWEPPD